MAHLFTPGRRQPSVPATSQPGLFIVFALVVGISLFYLAFLKPGIWGFDGNDAIHMSQSLITQGNFTVPPDSGGVEGRGGHFYSIRYPFLPMVATPFVGIGMLLADRLHLPVQYAAATCGLVLNVLLTAGTAALIFALTTRLRGTARGAYAAAIAFAFGTVAMVYSREFFAEPLLAFLITLALYLAFGRSRQAHIAAALLIIPAILTKPAGVLLAPVLGLYFLLKRYAWWQILLPGVSTLVGIGGFLLYNYVRFENWFTSGQNPSHLSFDGFGWRALGQLVSPGAGGGLLLYCPPTLLALWGGWQLWKRQKAEAIALIGIILGFWLLHSGWDFNGWNWGPRFLVPIIPSMMVFVGGLGKRWRMPLIGLTLLGFLINAPTLVAYYQRYLAELSDQGTALLMENLQLWHDPSQSPLLNIWGATGRQLHDALATPVQEIVANAGERPAGGQMAKAELLRIVAVWWWFLPVAGIPLWVGALTAGLLVSGALGLLWRGWRVSLTFKPPFTSTGADSNEWVKSQPW